MKHANVMEIAMDVALKCNADRKVVGQEHSTARTEDADRKDVDQTPNADRSGVVGLSLVGLGEVGLKEGEGPKGVVLDAVALKDVSLG